MKQSQKPKNILELLNASSEQLNDWSSEVSLSDPTSFEDEKKLAEAWLKQEHSPPVEEVSVSKEKAVPSGFQLFVAWFRQPFVMIPMVTVTALLLVVSGDPSKIEPIGKVKPSVRRTTKRLPEKRMLQSPVRRRSQGNELSQPEDRLVKKGGVTEGRSLGVSLVLAKRREPAREGSSRSDSKVEKVRQHSKSDRIKKNSEIVTGSKTSEGNPSHTGKSKTEAQAIVRIKNGVSLRSSDYIYFGWKLFSPGYIYLFSIEKEKSRLLFPFHPKKIKIWKAGFANLSKDGVPQRYRLTRHQGKTTFLVLQSLKILASSELQKLQASSKPVRLLKIWQKRATQNAKLSFDSFDLFIKK